VPVPKCQQQMFVTLPAACKNKAVEVQPVNRNPSAFARHLRALEESENEIKVNITLYQVH